MRTTIAALALLALGCGQKSDPAIVGRWDQRMVVEQKWYGEEAGMAEAGKRIEERQQVHYEFRADGTYVYRLGTAEFPGEWSSNDNTVKLKNGTELTLSEDKSALSGLDSGGNAVNLTKAE
ncbi:MAG: hypothetical protein WD716_13295 [Fimbriimonadaceae bacterium]